MARLTKLQRLKLLTEEMDAPAADLSEGCPCGEAWQPLASPRLYTDEQLKQQLALYKGDVEAAAYAVLIRKAQASEITLSGGLKLADQSKYWLRLAAGLRQNHTHNAPRADDIPVKPPNKKGG